MDTPTPTADNMHKTVILLLKIAIPTNKVSHKVSKILLNWGAGIPSLEK